MKRRQAMKGIILFSLGSSLVYSCHDPYQAIRNLNLDFVKPLDKQMDIIDSISKLVVPLDKIPALAQHTALPFILKMVDDIAESEDRDRFIASYMSFDQNIEALEHKKYSAMSIEEQASLLDRFNKREKGLPEGGQSMFDMIKGLSLQYLTSSEFFQRTVNYYEMAPGRFKGDVLLSELQNANKE